ncbi:MAG: hypothetical protein FWF26_04125 [Treponema sp.]|nr:hypothetical protein [Treponema sp.]
MADDEKPSPETPVPKESVTTARIHDSANTDTVYYYSRERRLDRASPSVQAMNDGKPIRPSLSRTLFATSGHKMIFATIIFALLALALASRFAGRDNGVTLGGNTLEFSIAREAGVLILQLVKTMPKSGEAYIGPVEINVSPVVPKAKEGDTQAAPRVFIDSITFNAIESETYNTTLPFDGSDFIVVFKNSGEQKSLRLKVKS